MLIAATTSPIWAAATEAAAAAAGQDPEYYDTLQRSHAALVRGNEGALYRSDGSSAGSSAGTSSHRGTGTGGNSSGSSDIYGSRLSGGTHLRASDLDMASPSSGLGSSLSLGGTAPSSSSSSLGASGLSSGFSGTSYGLSASNALLSPSSGAQSDAVLTRLGPQRAAQLAAAAYGAQHHGVGSSDGSERF